MHIIRVSDRSDRTDYKTIFYLNRSPLIEPLTNRELEILELLAQRLQNKEISEKLFVSPTTVKTHLQNIYQKLSVSGRRQAVESAKNLGIL